MALLHDSQLDEHSLPSSTRRPCPGRLFERGSAPASGLEGGVGSIGGGDRSRTGDGGLAVVGRRCAAVVSETRLCRTVRYLGRSSAGSCSCPARSSSVLSAMRRQTQHARRAKMPQRSRPGLGEEGRATWPAPSRPRVSDRLGDADRPATCSASLLEHFDAAVARAHRQRSADSRSCRPSRSYFVPA